MIRERSTWDTLPIEILERIVNHCGSDYHSTKWMFVNKKWFDYYLSRAYHSITIDLSKQDITFDKIGSFGLNVRRLIKQITFGGFPRVNDFTEHDIPDDKLSRLMKRTPNVKEVYFSSSQTFDVTDWTYFSVIVLKNDYWKLRVLPEPINEIMHSSAYYACAYHSRHTLKSLYLTLGMISSSHYECLKEFTALETLHLGKGFVISFDQLDIILRNLTNLKETIVDFGSKRFMMLPKLKKKPYMYPNIKEITFNNFTPKENRELLMFAENFIGLENLQIVGERNKLWPAAEVDPAVTEFFLDALDSFSGYQITIEGDVAMASLMEKWNSSVKRYSREVFLSIEYKIITSYSNTFTHFSLKISKDNSRSTTSLYYSIIAQSNCLSADEYTLTIISDAVSKVQLSGLNNDNQLITYLKAIFHQAHPNLKNVTVINSKLFSQDLGFLSQEEDLSLEGLEFYECTIGFKTFEIFSSRFNSLDYVKFIDCLFTKGDHDNSQYISMENSAVGTIYISNYQRLDMYSYNDIPQISVIFISVFSVDLNTTKYYIIADHNVMDVSQATYNTFKSKFGSTEIMNVDIQVKSVKQLLFKPSDSSCFIKIPLPKW